MNHLTWNHQVPVIQLLFINHLTWEPPQVTVVHQSSDLEPPSHCYFIRLGTTGATKPLLFVNHLTQIVVVVVVVVVVGGVGVVVVVVVVVVKPPFISLGTTKCPCYLSTRTMKSLVTWNHQVPVFHQLSDLEPPSQHQGISLK